MLRPRPKEEERLCWEPLLGGQQPTPPCPPESQKLRGVTPSAQRTWPTHQSLQLTSPEMDMVRLLQCTWPSGELAHKFRIRVSQEGHMEVWFHLLRCPPRTRYRAISCAKPGPVPPHALPAVRQRPPAGCWPPGSAAGRPEGALRPSTNTKARMQKSTMHTQAGYSSPSQITERSMWGRREQCGEGDQAQPWPGGHP